MKVSELGEFGLIRSIREMARRGGQGFNEDQLVLGIGDDAAVLKRPHGLLLATTDSMVEGVHFKRDSIRWRELGWKALAVNLSDIAAMGGVPVHTMVSLALPPETEVKWVLEMLRGFLKLAGREGVMLVGGNISRASQLSVAVTVLGETGSGNGYLSRGAARPGDLVAVTGWPGLSAAALLTMQSNGGSRTGINPLFQRAHFSPEPRLAEGRRLKSLGVLSAIDVSDGLLADLGHICDESNVSVVLHAPALPIHPRLKALFPKEAMDMVLGGGEDYELVFTGSEQIMRKAARQLVVPVTVIGEVVQRGRRRVRVVNERGRECLLMTGWDHFKKLPSTVRY
jgi:thiamine-monophosphate kinase